MRRKHTAGTDEPGQDSFLDVVANMVGILIILVTVVGVRASQAPLDAPPAEVPAPAPPAQPQQADRTAEYRSAAYSLEADIRRIDEQTKQVQSDIAARRKQREMLATFVAAIKIELAERRAALDAAGQQAFDLNNQLSQAQQKLEQLEREQAELSLTRPSTVQVQNLPTPLSKTVHGREIHFQLRGGRLTSIPLEKLLDEFQAEAKHKIWKLKDRNQFIDTVGPIEGFRMRYEIGRFDVSLNEGVPGGRTGSMVQLVRWELLPVSGTLGETVDQALSAGSIFRRVVSGLDPKHDTITVWVYPESFVDFRRVKAELHALGIPTAGRPLPNGQTIGGSPNGSRSAAQ